MTTDTQPLSEWIQRPGEVIARVKRSGDPMMLTVDGRADVMVMDAAAYAAMQGGEAFISMEELQRSLDDADAGRVRPMLEALGEIAARHGL